MVFSEKSDGQLAEKLSSEILGFDFDGFFFPDTENRSSELMLVDDMEETEDGLDEWKDHSLSPNVSFSGSIGDVLSRGEDILGANNENEVENSMSTLVGKLERSESGLKNSSNVERDLGEIKNGSNLAERRAAKCGFNVSKISTPRFRSTSLLPSPGARSPFLTIPTGISPTALLDSPILLPNSQLSPTTGTLVSALDRDHQMVIPASTGDADKGGNGGYSSMLKPNKSRVPLACFNNGENKVSSAGGLPQSVEANVDCQSLTSVHLPVGFEFPVQLHEEAAMNNPDGDLLLQRKFSNHLPVNANSITLQPCRSDTLVHVQAQDKNEPSPPLGEDPGTYNNNSLEGDQKGSSPQMGTVRTAEDGYNWRKYGQKQVKGSEYPRSYYKCTHPNCQVKKKLERSRDGQITEIIYKGTHSHPKSQPCRKSTFGTSFSFSDASDIGNVSVSSVKPHGGSVWRNIQAAGEDFKIGSDWRTDGLERTSSASVLTEVSDPLSTTQEKPMGVLESAGTPEFSSTLASYEDDEEDAAIQAKYSLGDDDDDEPDSKRRKEGCFLETTLGSRAVREPRVVIQIQSEVDILDDGYRWRKYGQKVVKGNPNPRSYYKCTSAGCTVRKHVERASHDIKYVITTYEGKHNHEVPAARNSSHVNSGGGSLPPAAPNTPSTLTLPRNPHLPKPEPHGHDLPPHFDRKMEYNNDDFLRPSFLGNLGSGTSPFYPMKFPTLPNSTFCGAFGLTNHHQTYPGGIVPAIADFSIPLPLGFPRSSNLGIPNYSNPERLVSSVQSLFAAHQLNEGDVKLLKPKQEQGDDSLFDTSMHDIERSNSSSSSSTYKRNLEIFRPESFLYASGTTEQ